MPAYRGEATDWSRDGKRILGDNLEGHAWLVDLATRRKTDLVTTLTLKGAYFYACVSQKSEVAVHSSASHRILN